MSDPITGGELAILRETVRGKGDTPAGRLIAKIDDLEQQVARLTEIGEKRENHIQELLDDIERLTEERDKARRGMGECGECQFECEGVYIEGYDELCAHHADALRESLAAKDEALREVCRLARGEKGTFAIKVVRDIEAIARAALAESGKETG